MVRQTSLGPMCGAPPGAEMRVYAVAVRLGEAEGAQTREHAVAARLRGPVGF